MFKVKWAHLIVAFVMCVTLLIVSICCFNENTAEEYTAHYTLQYTVENVPEEQWVYFYDIARGYVYRCYIREDGNVQMLLNEDGNISIIGIIEPYMGANSVG